MEHPLISVVVTLVILVLFGYYTKLDMADVTGFARSSAKEAMPLLAGKFNYELIPARTEYQQAGLKKQFGRYIIEVNAEHSQIEVEFSKELGIYLSTLKDGEYDNNKFAALTFSNAKLNRFFKVRGVKSRQKIDSEKLESALLPLANYFDGRHVKYLYLENEYLRVGFEYRNYLPASLMEKSLPVIEQAAQGLLALK